jgi:phage tail protein X
MRKVRAIAGDTVNVLLFRVLGRSDDEAEEALWLLNPGLAEYGVTLPGGLEVVMPELSEKPTASRPVSVWD